MKKYGTLIFGIVGWVIALIIFFPIFWMAITAFKTEQGAYSPDLIFLPTLESFKDVFARSNYLLFVMNSIYVSIGSTFVCFLFAIPEFRPVRQPDRVDYHLHPDESPDRDLDVLHLLL